jgi:N utilization substance protein B
MMAAARSRSANVRPARRSAARLGAVQALYQMDLAHTDVSEVLAQFESRTSGVDFEGGDCGEADFKFLRDILEGVVREQNTIDPKIAECLAPGWPLDRLDSTLRAILRAAAYEIMFRRDVPARAIISEYLDIAHAFFGAEELDSLARSLTEPRL